METICGKIVCKGIALGNIYVLQKNIPAHRKEKCTDPEAEIALVNKAREAVVLELHGLYEQAVAEVGVSNAAIFQMHEMLLQDAEFIRNFIECTKQKYRCMQCSGRLVKQNLCI